MTGTDPDGGESATAARQEAPADSAAAATGFYDRWARLYDVIASAAPGIGRLRRRAVDALRLDRGDRVLEIGCGTGVNLPLLAREVGPRGTVVGVDRSRGVLERARRNARAYPQVDVVRADATVPPVGARAGTEGPAERQFDAVLATFVVGMFQSPAATVEAYCDLVAPGGYVALLHFRRSRGRAAPLANAGLFVATALSTPPTTRLRYDEDLTRLLDERVRSAGDVVRRRTDPTITESHAMDLLELTAGRVR